MLSGPPVPPPETPPFLPSSSSAPFLQVRFGQQKRYQDWFQRQYLSTPDSQSLRCDLIRYICGVVHPSNEVLSSDILPRWAIIGWLLTTCTVRGWAVGWRLLGGEGSSSLEFPIFPCFFLTLGLLTLTQQYPFLHFLPTECQPLSCLGLSLWKLTTLSISHLGLWLDRFSVFTAGPQAQISEASLSLLLAPRTIYGYSSEWLLPQIQGLSQTLTS